MAGGFSSVVILLGHGLDGNNVKPMQSAKGELNNWLAQK
jgi:hypothetical protein